MRLDEFNKYGTTIFCDCDGVLADFDKGVLDVSGKPMAFWEQSDKLSTIWNALASLEHEGEGFYEFIDLMPDAIQLWNHIKRMKPIVLTGIPRGTWAAPQKRNWVAEHFGTHVPVITCMSWEKAENAMEYLGQDHLQGCTLIDDRISAKAPWEKHGGTFVHHTSAASSIQEL